MRLKLGLFVLLLVLMTPAGIHGQVEDGEVVAYSAANLEGNTITLGYYDPRRHENTTILTQPYRGHILFALSKDGLLAYGVDVGSNWEVYLLDTTNPDRMPINISNNPSTDDRPLAWSPDGRQLAIASISAGDTSSVNVWDGETLTNVFPFGEGITVREFYAEWSPDGRYLVFSVQVDGAPRLAYVWDGTTTRSLAPPGVENPTYIDIFRWSPDGSRVVYHVGVGGGRSWPFVWDGETFTNIMPTEWLINGTVHGGMTWSQDGRIAMTISILRDGDTLSRSPREVYIWNGHTTFNLSQSPVLESYDPAWSSDGRVAFMSGEWIRTIGPGNPVLHVYLWDGVSYKNGVPERDSFIQVAPELVFAPYNYLRWLDDGRLIFTAYPADRSLGLQIYAWDGQQATNLSLNPYDNEMPRWSDTGLWAHATFYTSAPFLYVHEAEGRLVVMTKGQRFNWLAGDNMIICQIEPHWHLFYWSRHEMTAIAEGGEIVAMGQSGHGVICRSGG